MTLRATLTFACCWALALASVPAAAQTTGRFPDSPAAAPPPAPTLPPAYPRPQEPVLDRRPAPSVPAPQRPAPAPAPTLRLPEPQPPGTFLPPVLPYREGAPVPSGYRLVTEANSGLIVGGLLVEIAGYVAAFAIGAAYDFDNGAGWLVVPVIGPWAALGARENPCAGIQAETATLADAECVNEALSEAKLIAFLTVDGMIQMIGTGLMLVGAVTPRRELVRADVAGFRLTPVSMGKGGVGLSAHTSF